MPGFRLKECLGLVLLSCCAHGCAAHLTGGREGAPLHAGQTPGLAVHAEEDELTGLESYGADELYELADQAFDEGDFNRSAGLYRRLADAFPDWGDRNAVLFNLALSLERGRAFGPALEEWQGLQALAPGDPSLSFRSIHCLQELGRWEEARDELTSLLATPLERPDYLEARLLLSRAWIALESLEAAERELTGLLPRIRRDPSTAGDPYYSGMAWFFVGELYRAKAEAIHLTQVDDVEAARAELEEKARWVLEAQHHYSQAIMTRSSDWRAAAGYRYGQLFEAFHSTVQNAPRPDGVEGEHYEVYREMLMERTEILLEKARDAYQKVLNDARARGREDQWVARLQEALERLEPPSIGDF